MSGINSELLALLDIDTIQSEIIIKLTDEISERVSEDIRNKLFTKAEAQVDITVAAIIEEVTTQVFQPVTSWGEPNGEPTSIRGMMEKSIKDWWNTNVDRQGSPSNYNCKPRAQYYAEKVIGEYVDNNLRHEMKQIIDDGKTKVRAAMGEAIATQIKQIW
uniref:Uncharacterized protein n=1 Tax=viral metagenome TaxID=1070528 RepID=A0A6M3K983_9ZZZZ